MSTQKQKIQDYEDFCKLASGVLKHSVSVLCSRDVKGEHLHALETHEVESDKGLDTVAVTREQAHALDMWLYDSGEARCNVITSAHEAELGWLNDQPCACRFSRIAEILGETPEDLRKHIVKNMLQPSAPKGVYFTTEGPLALVCRQEVSA